MSITSPLSRIRSITSARPLGCGARATPPPVPRVASVVLAIASLPQLRLFDDDDLPRVDLRFDDDDDEREPERLPLLDPRPRLDEPFGSPPFDERLRLDDLPRERER